MWVNRKEWKIMTEHVGVLNKEMGQVLESLRIQAHELDWVRKLLWVVLSVVLSNAVVATVAVVLKLLDVI